MNNKLEKLREKLADIEHQRWSDWQKYMHSKLRYAEIKGEDSKNYAYYLMEASDYERWERQIATPYAELSEAEKQSDRNQVDRYWQLILAIMDEEIQKEMERYKKYLKYHLKNYGIESVKELLST